MYIRDLNRKFLLTPFVVYFNYYYHYYSKSFNEKKLYTLCSIQEKLLLTFTENVEVHKM